MNSLRTSFEVWRKASDIFREYALELYFPAQRLSRRQRAWCTPFLFLIEYLVYRVDAVSEHTRDTELDAPDNEDYANLVRYKRKFEWLLRRTGVYNEAIARQLDLGERYVRLENRVTTQGGAGHEEAVRLAELRSSDVRLLHGMIFALLGRPVDRHLLDLLWPVEVLADIGNDLAHYGDDVDTGRFNVYRAFVLLYGNDAPERLRAEMSRYEVMFRAGLDRFPEERRAHLLPLCVRRAHARTEVIPVPIF